MNPPDQPTPHAGTPEWPKPFAGTPTPTLAPTPRTDAALEWVRPAGNDSGPPNEQYVSAEVARTLERELAAANKRIADCEFLSQHRYKIIQRQEPRCNEAIARAEKAEAELANIANAKPHTWGDMSDSFQAWAQSRARHALAAMKGTI
jgi:hypothetical protein